MSQELERVYTINLGKVLLSPDNQRAKRAINMIREFARHHMKTEEIKIEEDLSHQIWARGIRSPPRKIRVRMTKTDDGYILVSPYEEEVVKEESKKESKKESKASKKEEPKKESKKEEPKKESKKEEPKKESKKEEPKKESKKEEPKKESKKPSKK